MEGVNDVLMTEVYCRINVWCTKYQARGRHLILVLAVLTDLSTLKLAGAPANAADAVELSLARVVFRMSARRAIALGMRLFRIIISSSVLVVAICN